MGQPSLRCGLASLSVLLAFGAAHRSVAQDAYCSLGGTNYRVTTLYQSLITSPNEAPPTTPCSTDYTTRYDPEVFMTPSGTLRLLAQGGEPTCYFGGDAFFRSERDVNGNWTSLGCPPAMTANWSGCLTNPDALASPSVVAVPTSGGTRYFMAIVGRGVDFGIGEVYWAYSTDGMNWTPYAVNAIYPAPHWTPIVEPWPVQSMPCDHYGVGQLALNYVSAGQDPAFGANGGFYLHLSYHHQTGEFDTIAYRISFDPTSASGLGALRQIYHDGAWYNHSGRLVWSYEGIAPYPGDDTLYVYRMSQVDYGPGDIKYNPSQGNWLRVYAKIVAADTTRIFWQTTQALGSESWTPGQCVDLEGLYDQALRRYPYLKFTYHSNTLGTDARYDYYPGLWADGSGTYLFLPVNYRGCSMYFHGLGIVVGRMELTNGNPAGTPLTVSPATGSPAGGAPVTISGYAFEAGARLAFGGVAATVTSLTSSQITAVTPAHAAGPVNVTVTNWDGTTQTGSNAFSYVVVPTSLGFSPTTIGSNGSSTGTVTLSSPAPADGATVSLTANPAGIVTVPSIVTVQPGSQQATFLATTGAVCASATVTVTATAGGGSASSTLAVQSSATTSIAWVKPSGVTWGPPNTLTVAGYARGGCGAVQMVWRDATANDPWNVVAYQPIPSPTDGTWSNTIPSSNYCHTYQIYANYSGVASTVFAFNGLSSGYCNETARVIWIQPQPLAGFGPAGSLVLAGSASNAPAGTGVALWWRDVTTNGWWTQAPYVAPADANGIWYNSIANANYSHMYDIYVTYDAYTSAHCTYQGNNALNSCP